MIRQLKYVEISDAPTSPHTAPVTKSERHLCLLFFCSYFFFSWHFLSLTPSFLTLSSCICLSMLSFCDCFFFLSLSLSLSLSFLSFFLWPFRSVTFSFCNLFWQTHSTWRIPSSCKKKSDTFDPFAREGNLILCIDAFFSFCYTPVRESDTGEAGQVVARGNKMRPRWTSKYLHINIKLRIQKQHMKYKHQYNIHISPYLFFFGFAWSGAEQPQLMQGMSGLANDYYAYFGRVMQMQVGLPAGLCNRSHDSRSWWREDCTGFLQGFGDAQEVLQRQALEHCRGVDLWCRRSQLEG